MRAAVIVLGDLGRSPRMQYHALAFAVNDVDVDLIGEEGVELPAWLRHPRIHVHRLKARRGFSGVTGAALALFVRGLRLRRPGVILVQTPPAIPTLMVAWALAKVRRARLVFDWHNLGWTLLGARLGPAHPAVAVARALERMSSGLADGHLAVSEALARHLRATWHLGPVSVLRDRPGEAFRPRDDGGAMRARVLQLAGFPPDARPGIVLSPTSWTRDEAVELVLGAADELEAAWSAGGPSDGLVIVISGSGAGRAAFDRSVLARRARRVRVVTTWVSGDDYPALVACADAGVSLHRSSSGLDLPMKICDLFGAAVPVCALDYGATLREMVVPGANALLFTSGPELASLLDALFRSWPLRPALWERLHAGAATVAAGPRWIDGWQREAREMLISPAM